MERGHLFEGVCFQSPVEKNLTQKENQEGSAPVLGPGEPPLHQLCSPPQVGRHSRASWLQRGAGGAADGRVL